MKIKCENVVACGNYNCVHNTEAHCVRKVVALDASGKCVLFNQKRLVGAAPANEKSNAC